MVDPAPGYSAHAKRNLVSSRTRTNANERERLWNSDSATSTPSELATTANSLYRSATAEYCEIIVLDHLKDYFLPLWY